VMQETWIGQGKGFILVYSIDNEESFQEIKKIKKRIDRIKNFAQVSAILVGNKCDRPDRVISFEQGKALANELNMMFLETSAKTGMNCEETFITLARDIKKKEAPTPVVKDKGFFDKIFDACNLI
jgi:GTPase SAR1 family protein